MLTLKTMKVLWGLFETMNGIDTVKTLGVADKVVMLIKQ